MSQYWLCENVPFTNSYESVVSFETKEVQRSYFLNLSVRTDTANRFRFEDNRVTFRIKMSYNDCKNVNYMMLQQDGDYYFLFVDSIIYSDVDTTQVVASVDIWQTYMFEHHIKDAFITREHQDRFRVSGNNLIPIYNLEKENIELGEEYENISVHKNYDPNDLSNFRKITWYYVITSETLGTGVTLDAYTIYGDSGKSTRMPYYMYCIPVGGGGTTTIPAVYRFRVSDGLPEEKYYTMANRNELDEIMSNPKVISIYASAYGLGPYTTTFNTTDNTYDIKFNSSVTGIGFNDSVGMIAVRYNRTKAKDFTFNIKNIRTTKYGIGTSLSVANEPKLHTKPYTIYSFTNMVSESLDVGADEFDTHIKFIESLGTSYKSVIYSDKFDTTSYFNGIVSTKNNELPLMSDKYLDYILNNKASATTGLAISTGQAVGGFALAGLLPGYGSLIGISQGIAGTKAVMNELMKQSDLKSAPKTIREVGNNIQFQLELDNDSLVLQGITRRVKQQFFDRAHQVFHRTGYKANRFGIPNLKSRYYFNYIELLTVDIGGNLNQSIKTRLESIYKNGVRIWHYRDSQTFDMYNYQFENVEVSLLE